MNKFSGLDLADPSPQHDSGNDVLSSNIPEEQIIGIGVEVRQHTDGRRVVKPVRGGGLADQAGIEPGDIIIRIHGRDIRGMRIDNSIDLLQ